jgi:hypothetical protein
MSVTALLGFALCSVRARSDESFAVALPDGVEAVWNADKAFQEITATRERICINGLWRWQPAGAVNEGPPSKGWGYFKVPGCWPGITDYMQKDSQTVFAHPAWKDQALRGITAAWFEREIEVPASWRERRIVLSAEYLNSHATVYLDGQRRGELKFPGGELELTTHMQPGSKQTLSLLVEEMPLKAVLVSYNDTNAARETRGNVARRGLCGDVFLVSTPAKERIGNIKVDTSVRKSEIAIDAALEGLDPATSYALLAKVTAKRQIVREYRSRPFGVADLKAGRFVFTHPGTAKSPGDLDSAPYWDLHTPKNQFELELTLEAVSGSALDRSFWGSFGYREFWIDDKDFYLNGSKIHLSAVPLDNAQCGAAWANYAGARESLERLKSFGVNFVYTHNYGCQPGDHLSFDEILRAADDVGMLVALSQPHFSHYDWQAADADEKNGYARHAEFYVRQAQNHPSVVAYSMSHNACGYSEDMNPDMIGTHDPRSSGELNNVRRALRAEAIVKRLDPGRIVYHHAGGNIGAIHTMNFYPNWVPIQEMSDWFEHWATTGVKPAFTCEYGAPFSWDWAMYRGWYKGERSFGSARVPWDFCLAEWNAQYTGDRAFQISNYEKDNLRFEAKKLLAGQVWNRWDYPHDLNSKLFGERYPIVAQHITDNWRAFRTWGVSAISAWEHGMYWKLKEGVDRGRKELPVDWESLQRPGFSADYTAQRYERMDLAYERDDWEPTEAAKALLRNNMPLLGYIAGKPDAFTSKDHNFYPGETIEKQLVLINNSRESVECNFRWGAAIFPHGEASRIVPAGEGASFPLKFPLSQYATRGMDQIATKIGFTLSGGLLALEDDSFAVHILPRPRELELRARIALFDPRGETAALLKERGVRYTAISAEGDLSPFGMLVVGKGALTADGPAPDIKRVRDGLKVVMFEQKANALEKRLGFRVTEYGLRNVFRRVPDHPLLAGLETEHLRDWRGEATLVPRRLNYKLQPRLGPTVEWCGMSVPRLWRCGNRGNVASVLIEKPARGDFLPILDGGYSLQYSPLMEYREGKGMILFCQMDVIGRTENDPAAETLVHNILKYVDGWRPEVRRRASYVGNAAEKSHFEAVGLALEPFAAEKLSEEQVVIVGPGGGKELSADSPNVAAWLRGGGHILGIGLSEQDLQSLPMKVATRRAEHIASFFEAAGRASPLVGIGPADVHNREPKELPLVSGGATIVGDGVLAYSTDGRVVLCQLAPWTLGGSEQLNHRKTFRRSSFLATRLAANAGAAFSTPLVERFGRPVVENEQRWLEGLYLDRPEEWDDPYRYFRW